jgi:RNA polymerase sigma-70 factor (ECF subfamily)
MQEQNVLDQVKPYKDKVYRFAFNLVGNTMDAEDILQELFIKIWHKKDQFNDIENKEAWCMTVTRNMCIDKLRAKKKAASDISEHQNISDQGPTPDKSLEQKDSLNRVMKILEELPASQREIIHLRDVEGYTYKEIAEMTELTEDQVKVNLFRARQKLKEKLKGFKPL